jgi:nicotinamidase/pyrazinamidase
MASRDVIFWEVDTQNDFMLPGGKLYVPGAEKLLPNIKRLTGAAREGKVFLVSHGCVHPEGDPEFAQFPPHCIRGTKGAEMVPEAMTDVVFRVPNTPDAKLPANLDSYQQVLLEKETIDFFQSRHADELVDKLGTGPEFVIFGVVTEYCVGSAAKGLLQRGRRVSVVKDAIQTLKPEDGNAALDQLRSLGATIITTDEALKKLS